ncbi:MAG: Excinuclease ABC C subunit domain protein, partial [Parcubacteria group bacterium GW2011_GWF2_43_11]
MWYIYIVKCQDDSFYVGTSSDLTRRFQEHKDGRGGKYTSHHKPSKIIYS